MQKKPSASLPGFEPGTFGLEVQRAIHCATGTSKNSCLVKVHITVLFPKLDIYFFIYIR